MIYLSIFQIKTKLLKKMLSQNPSFNEFGFEFAFSLLDFQAWSQIYILNMYILMCSNTLFTRFIKIVKGTNV